MEILKYLKPEKYKYTLKNNPDFNYTFLNEALIVPI